MRLQVAMHGVSQVAPPYAIDDIIWPGTFTVDAGPLTLVTNLPAGIADQAERELLLKLARDFELTGDRAMEWEGDNKTQFQYPDPSAM